MGKDFIKRQQDINQQFFDVGEEIGIQKMCDYISAVLKDPRFMGKDVFGRKRLDKVFEGLKWYASEFEDAFTGSKEADYKQEQLDKLQQDAWGADFQPFYTRYPWLKKLGYKKPRKGWVD